MRLDRIINIEDFRLAAKRSLPKIVFDFIEGGVDNEQGLATNSSIRERYHLVPRYLRDIEPIDQSIELFGHRYDASFGIAPTGLNGLFRPGTDLALAGAAASANIPFVISTASTATLEEAASVAGKNAWYQLYGSREPAVTADMIRRADAAGIRTLMLTVDAPVNAKRERNIRNGFGRPGPMRPSILLDALLHPLWLSRYVRSGGMPTFGNFEPYAGDRPTSKAVISFTMSQTPNAQTWADFETVRALWPYTLLVKGLMHPDDAAHAVDLGAQGVVVSNHGGRVFDRAPSTFEMLPHIRQAVGDRAAVMVDSGVARGADIVTAYCLGADFVFVGRATLYAAIVGAREGALHAVRLLCQEIELVLGQMGCRTITGLDGSYLLSSIGRRG